MRSGLGSVNTGLPKKTYLRKSGGLVSEIGGSLSASTLLHSGNGDGVVDPKLGTPLPPQEAFQSRNTRGPYLDRGEVYLDVYDSETGWRKILLADFLSQSTSSSSTDLNLIPPETFYVNVPGSTDFALTKTPIQYSETVTLNGVELKNGSTDDYTIVGTVVRFNVLWDLQVGDRITVRYSSKE